MLAVPADRLPAAIGDLDPGNRALLDLSLRRGVSDAEIGQLLRKEPGEVARGRDAVLELLADALDVPGHDRRDRVRSAVAALPDDAWQPPAAAAPAAPPLPIQPEEPPEPPAPPSDRDRERAVAARVLDEEHRFEPEPPKRSRRAGLLALLGLLAVVIALILVLSSGGDEDEPEGGSGNGSPPAQNGGPAPGGSKQELATVGGGKGSGTLAVTDDGATITIRGLPDPKGGVYGVWLYDSVVRAKPLGTLPDGSGQLEVALPPDAGDYRFLDVSLEPGDGNPNHSGDSVLRAPLRQLLAG
jgi:hypothetical protein